MDADADVLGCHGIQNDAGAEVPARRKAATESAWSMLIEAANRGIPRTSST
jgi:hypothetical protein